MDEYYEDVTVGETRSFGSYEVTREEIVDFAEKYDPQPFHTDPDAARNSMFGSLVASGWHTASISMRLLVDNYLNESGAMGSPGLESLRWLRPVRPGDVLSIEVRTTDKEPWDGDRGVVESHLETVRDDGETVMTWDSLVLFPRA
ncbi:MULTISPECIES: MaoC family dehydratase [Salinibaculum]|uniref:MaoC family dehydratase n=1 Tax=Salinibaculum TaxID=2732368 RepID=UPI0030D42B61